MQKLILLFLTTCIISCQYKNDKGNVESDESQILNLAFDKVIGSDTTFRFWMKRNPPPIPIIAFTDKIDSIEYLKKLHWRDSVLKILETASLYVVVYRYHEDMVDYYINNLLDTIKQKKGDTLFNGRTKNIVRPKLEQGHYEYFCFKTKIQFQNL